jgi:hypothetical protein
MDNFNTGLLTLARTDVKTGLAVCLAELEYQKLVDYSRSFFRTGQNKLCIPLLELVSERAMEDLIYFFCLNFSTHQGGYW